jgi:hypothetical protein
LKGTGVLQALYLSSPATAQNAWQLGRIPACQVRKCLVPGLELPAAASGAREQAAVAATAHNT